MPTYRAVYRLPMPADLPSVGSVWLHEDGREIRVTDVAVRPDLRGATMVYGVCVNQAELRRPGRKGPYRTTMLDVRNFGVRLTKVADPETT